MKDSLCLSSPAAPIADLMCGNDLPVGVHQYECVIDAVNSHQAIGSLCRHCFAFHGLLSLVVVTRV